MEEADNTEYNFLTRSEFQPAGRHFVMNQSGMPRDRFEHKKYYKPKEDHPSFDTDMTIRKIRNQLARTENIKTDPRFKWTRALKVQLLTRNMSEELRNKIKMDTYM